MVPPPEIKFGPKLRGNHQCQGQLLYQSLHVSATYLSKISTSNWVQEPSSDEVSTKIKVKSAMSR